MNPMVTSTVEHNQKLQKFIDIGYELVSENGFSATLAYYPYNTQYVKIVTVEHGSLTNTLILTPKQLRVLSEHVGMKFSTKKGSIRSIKGV